MRIILAADMWQFEQYSTHLLAKENQYSASLISPHKVSGPVLIESWEQLGAEISLRCSVKWWKYLWKIHYIFADSSSCLNLNVDLYRCALALEKKKTCLLKILTPQSWEFTFCERKTFAFEIKDSEVERLALSMRLSSI